MEEGRDGVRREMRRGSRSAPTGARGDVWLPSGTHLTSYIVLMMPLAWFLAIPRHMGIIGLVWAVVIASLASSTLLTGRFIRIARRLPQGV